MVSIRARRTNLFDPYGNYQGTSLTGELYVDWEKQQFVTDDPLSLNLYTYCANNPITLSDPTGHLGKNTSLGAGWQYRIDTPKDGRTHIHIWNGKDSYSQNDDGEPHDKGNNKPGLPPKKVLKKLKEKAGWDYKQKHDDWFSQAVMSIGEPPVLIYADKTEVIVNNPYSLCLCIDYIRFVEGYYYKHLSTNFDPASFTQVITPELSPPALPNLGSINFNFSIPQIPFAPLLGLA